MTDRQFTYISTFVDLDDALARVRELLDDESTVIVDRTCEGDGWIVGLVE